MQGGWVWVSSKPPNGGFMGGCLSSPLGSGEMVGGLIAILAVGWWLALAIYFRPPAAPLPPRPPLTALASASGPP